MASWRDLVLSRFAADGSLAKRFHVANGLRTSMPAFAREFPTNSALEMSAQRVLQNLRDEGLVEFVGQGLYRLPKVASSASAPESEEDGVRRGLTNSHCI